MFRYFPANYVWNLSVDLAIEMGARIGEIEEMCAPLREAAEAPDAAGTQAFRETWVRMADKLCALADEDKARGRMLSAGEKLVRASSYLVTAERLQAHDAPGRLDLYRRELALFLEGSRLKGDAVQRVEIPYEPGPQVDASRRPPPEGGAPASGGRAPAQGRHLSALYLPAEGLKPGERAPILVQLNGLDSTKEMKHLVGLPAWLARRGVSSLVVDQPGTGEALRLHGMTARVDAEHWASRVVDWLETRDDVDPKRIGCEGVSLGGYYCPRAVAMEPRFAAGVCWGANHDWRDVQKKRLQKEGDFPVPHYWAHVCWVWGAKDIEDFMRIAEDVHLDGVVKKIRVPFLVTHGAKDSQIPLKWAERTYEQLVNSPKRELKIFTDREGGAQHASFDNSINAGHYIADWVAETLGAHTATR